MTTIPTERFNKLNWLKLHDRHCLTAEKSNATNNATTSGFKSVSNCVEKIFFTQLS